MEHTENQITLRGTLADEPEFSHENHGKRFYRFYLEVPRLSGTIDLLPVVAQEELVLGLGELCGQVLCVSGQIRSHNVRGDGPRKLLIFVFASSICPDEGESINHVVLEGPICREPTYRRTPLGR